MENKYSIFVGSLSPDTTSEKLEDYFKRFGPIDSAVVLQTKDQITNETRSREFGFVNFTNPESRTNALLQKNGPHFIDNKQVECKTAIRRSDQKPDLGQRAAGGAGAGGGGGGRYDQSHYDNQKKVFVGGISNGTTDDDIKMALSNFGTVEAVEQKFDKVSQRMRGFGFVEFSSPEEAFKAAGFQFVQINGKTVEIKIAENRQPVQYQTSAGSFRAGSFGNSMAMYNAPLGFSGFSPYPGGAGSSYGAGGGGAGAGGAPGYMGSGGPAYGGAGQGYGGSSNQYQGYATKDGTNPYGSGAGNAYNASSGFGAGSATSYGGGTGSGYPSAGYGRGAYHPYGQ